MTQPISYLGYEPPYRTTFEPEEAGNNPQSTWRLDGKDNVQTYYELQRNYHKGTHKRDPTDRNETWTDQSWLRQQENLLLFDTVASRLVLTDEQKTRARKLFNKLDFRRYSKNGDRGRGLLITAIVACAYVGWKDGLKCHPNTKELNRWFAEVLADYGVSQKELLPVFGRFQSDIERNQKLKTRPYDDREPDVVI